MSRCNQGASTSKPTGIHAGGLALRWAAVSLGTVLLLLGGLLGVFFVIRAYHTSQTSAATCPAISGHGRAAVTASVTPRRAITWIIGLRDINLLRHCGASSSLINIAFNNNHTYVFSLGNTLSKIGIPTAYYTSYAGIRAAFADGALPGRYKAVIYDNERWNQTPIVEQRSPDYYEHLVALLLHRHALTYIATPTPDLTWATGKPNKGSYNAYLRRNIAADAARYANVIDVQGQVRETNLPMFASFVTAAVRQARQANPDVMVLIGLRTNPLPYKGTAANRKLYAAYKAVANFADGYWLNVNGHPKPAIYLLTKIYGES